MNQRPRTIEEQVSLLRAKGMEFDNLSEVKALLARISYFRLKYFWTVLIDDSTDGDSNQIFASKYTLCLPNKEQLIAEVEKMLVRHPFPLLSSFPLLVILNAVKDLYTPTFVYTNLFTFAVFTLYSCLCIYKCEQ